MLAAPNLGADYARAFDGIFPELAASGQLLFYPFFLAGVLDDPQLVQRDGLHPTAAGVDAIVAGILPTAAGAGGAGARPQRRLSRRGRSVAACESAPAALYEVQAATRSDAARVSIVPRNSHAAYLHRS